MVKLGEVLASSMLYNMSLHHNCLNRGYFYCNFWPCDMFSVSMAELITILYLYNINLWYVCKDIYHIAIFLSIILGLLINYYYRCIHRPQVQIYACYKKYTLYTQEKNYLTKTII